MGLRSAIRAGTELCALGMHQRSTRDFLIQARLEGVTSALNDRDGAFGDYRTAPPQPGEAEIEGDNEKMGMAI